MTRKDNTTDHIQNTTSQKLQMDTDQRTIKSKTDLKDTIGVLYDGQRQQKTLISLILLYLF